MTGKTHLAAGITAGLAGAITLKNMGLAMSVPEMYMYISLAGLGSLVPDIDIPTSKLGSRLKPLSNIIRVLFGHRTLTHAPLLYAALIASFMTFTSIRLYGLIFCIGAITHLVLDGLNRKGIPLWFPFSRKHYHFIGVSSQGIVDKLLCALLYIIDFGLLFVLIGGAL